MPTRLAVAALLPETDESVAARRQDFVSKEFELEELPTVLAELEAVAPGWRALTFVHVEDLPLLMQERPGAY